MQLKPINQQVVVIVGATSGIGRAAALRFGEQGARLLVSSRSQAELDSLVAEISARGGHAIAFVADASDFEQVQAIADTAANSFGRIDTWVHSAAVMMYAPFSETTPEEFKRMIEVNLLGQVYGAMAALPHLRREGRGALIHLSSVEARRSLPYQSAYAASKHGMIGFIDSLRTELDEASLPINVTNIMPSGINTPLYEKALTRLGVQPQPVPPIYEPELVADAILFAAENPARDLVIGGAGKALALVERLYPRLADKIVELIAFQGQKTRIPKSEHEPNNLFSHLSGYDRVHGPYEDQARSNSAYTWLRTRPLTAWIVTGVATLATVALVSHRIQKG
jgi:NAD(P)-dependent dehydrogenase (short-subunit alcohol dehydrogenase family)